ncbi:MAG TPA: GAF domain-containing protein, partial [Gemmatimonadaceae bacterium]
MANDRHANAASAPRSGKTYDARNEILADSVLRKVQQERDHLLLLHEALADVERATTLEDRLQIFVAAICRIGFGRVTITLRDDDLNATRIVTAGLTPAEDARLRENPVPGHVWARRLTMIDRFRVSNSFYLDGADAWVKEEFGDGLRSQLEPVADSDWLPADMLLVPLRSAKGAVVATLVLDDPSDRARPTLMRVHTVELFAQQVASMLEHAALIEVADRRARRLQHVHQVGLLLAQSLDEPTILRSLAEQIERILPVTTVGVLPPEDADATWPSVLRRDGKEQDEFFVPQDLRSLASVAARTQRAARVGAALAVPSMLGTATVGVVVVEAKPGEHVSEPDAELLATIAMQAAAAISNARLYAASQRQRRQMEALAEIARAVGESLRIDRVMQLILRHACALLRTDGATIALLRGEVLEVTAGVGAGRNLVGAQLTLGTSLAGRAVRSSISIIEDDVRADDDAFGASVPAGDVRNAVVVPMFTADGPIGALSVFNRVTPFTDDDAGILQRLADQVAFAVVHARLFEEVGEATREWAVAFDSIGSGMVLLDRDGIIRRTNARARALMLVEREDELVGRPFHTALFGDEAPCEHCVHLAAIRDGAVTRGT